MNRRSWPGLLAMAFALAALSCHAASAESAPAGNPAARATSVLLVANLGEADEPCTCGDIIRAVRAAVARGVKAREVDTHNKDEKAKVAQQYRLTVTPSVLFLDDGGGEVRRFEGESKESLDGVKASLDAMTKKP